MEVKIYKTHQFRTTIGRCEVEKVHAVVVQSTFGSENVQNTWCSDPFFDEWIAIRCRKSARRCGAKHIWKPNVSKTEGFDPLLIDVSDVVLFTDRQT